MAKTIAKKAPMEVRKADLTENATGMHRVLEEVKKRDKKMKKVPLRIDHRTIILVKPKNCTSEYAEQTRQKIARGYDLRR